MKKNNEIINLIMDREIIKNVPVLDVNDIRKSLNIGRDSAYKILNYFNSKL